MTDPKARAEEDELNHIMNLEIDRKTLFIAPMMLLVTKLKTPAEGEEGR